MLIPILYAAVNGQVIVLPQSPQFLFFPADVEAILSIPDFSEDVAAILSFPDLSAEVDVLMSLQPDSFTAGGVTTPCVFMFADQPAQQGHIGSGQQMAVGYVLVKTTDFPSLKRGDAVTVNGAAFSVQLASRIQDGAITQVMLGKA